MKVSDLQHSTPGYDNFIEYHKITYLDGLTLEKNVFIS